MLSVLSQVYTFRRGEGQAFLRFFLRFVRGCAILFVELNRKQQVRSVTLPHRAAAGTLKGKRVQILHDLVTVIRESTVRVLLHRSLSHPAWEGGQRALSFESGNLPAVGTGALPPQITRNWLYQKACKIRGLFALPFRKQKAPFFVGFLSCTLLFGAVFHPHQERKTQ